MYDFKSAGNEKAIKLKYLDELKESKWLEQDLRKHLDQNKVFKLKLEIKITNKIKKIPKYEQDKNDIKESKTKDSLSF